MEIEDLVFRLASWVGAGIIDADQAQRILTLEDRDAVVEPPTPTHLDLPTMFEDMRAFVNAHPSSVLIPSDDPMWRLLGWIGYYQPEGEDEKQQLFSIRLPDVKSGLETLPPTMRDAFKASAGRRRITQWIRRDIDGVTSNA